VNAEETEALAALGKLSLAGFTPGESTENGFLPNAVTFVRQRWDLLDIVRVESPRSCSAIRAIGGLDPEDKGKNVGRMGPSATGSVPSVVETVLSWPVVVAASEDEMP
jgi:hypothetical protein